MMAEATAREGRDRTIFGKLFVEHAEQMFGPIDPTLYQGHFFRSIIWKQIFVRCELRIHQYAFVSFFLALNLFPSRFVWIATGYWIIDVNGS